MEKGSKDRKDSLTSSERFENLSYERHSGLLPKRLNPYQQYRQYRF